MYHAQNLAKRGISCTKPREARYNSAAFFNRLDKWVNNVIEDVYVERNMEVHSNIKNDLSSIRLKENFLTISQTLFDYLVEFNQKSDSDINICIGRIAAYKATL